MQRIGWFFNHSRIFLLKKQFWNRPFLLYKRDWQQWYLLVYCLKLWVKKSHILFYGLRALIENILSDQIFLRSDRISKSVYFWFCQLRPDRLTFRYSAVKINSKLFSKVTIHFSRVRKAKREKEWVYRG